MGHRFTMRVAAVQVLARIVVEEIAREVAKVVAPARARVIVVDSYKGGSSQEVASFICLYVILWINTGRAVWKKVELKQLH